MNEDRFAAEVTVIGFDGDDTLWHSEDAFALAQERLADLLARMPRRGGAGSIAGDREAQPRAVRLRHQGVHAVHDRDCIEVSTARYRSRTSSALLGTGGRCLARPVGLLPGVARRYRSWATAIASPSSPRVIFSTRRARSRAQGCRTVREHRHLEREDRDSYLQIFRRLEIEPEQFLMVGTARCPTRCRSSRCKVGPCLCRTR